MVDAHDVDGMLQVAHGIVEGGVAILHQETMIERDLHDTTMLGKGPHLVVREVARVVAECAAAAMAAHDRRAAELQGIVETLLASMAEVDHDAQAVHLADDLTTKGADTIMGMLATCAVADVVVAIVAQRHIDDATLGEVAQVVEAALEGMAILDAEHDALPALVLVQPQVVGRAGDGDMLAMLGDDGLYLVEDVVSILLGMLVKGHGLWQVGHHDGAWDARQAAWSAVDRPP